MLLKKLFQVWFHHRVVLECWHKLRNTVRQTISVILLRHNLLSSNTTTKLLLSNSSNNPHPKPVTKCNFHNMHRSNQVIQWMLQNKGWRAPLWIKEFKEVIQEKTMTITMTRINSNMLGTKVIWAITICHLSTIWVSIKDKSFRGLDSLKHQVELEAKHGKTKTNSKIYIESLRKCYF